MVRYCHYYIQPPTTLNQNNVFEDCRCSMGIPAIGGRTSLLPNVGKAVYRTAHGGGGFGCSCRDPPGRELHTRQAQVERHQRRVHERAQPRALPLPHALEEPPFEVDPAEPREAGRGWGRGGAMPTQVIPSPLETVSRPVSECRGRRQTGPKKERSAGTDGGSSSVSGCFRQLPGRVKKVDTFHPR